MDDKLKKEVSNDDIIKLAIETLRSELHNRSSPRNVNVDVKCHSSTQDIMHLGRIDPIIGLYKTYTVTITSLVDVIE